MPLTLLPSAVAAFVAWAKAQTDLAAIHSGRVGTKLNATLPAMRVQQLGGAPDGYENVDEPLLQAECWAADDVAAELFVRTLVAALKDPVTGFRHRAITGGRVYTFDIDSGPFFAPDDPQLSTNVRYVLTLRLLTTS